MMGRYEKSLAIIFCLCAGASLAMFSILIAASGVPLQAFHQALLPLAVALPIHTIYDRYGNHRSRSAYLKDFTFERFTYDWKIVVPYAFVLFAFGSYWTGFVSGVLARAATADSPFGLAPTAGTFSILLAAILCSFLGHWIGSRSNCFGILNTVGLMIIGSALGRATEIVFSRSEDFAIVHGDLAMDWQFVIRGFILDMIMAGVPAITAAAFGKATQELQYARAVLSLASRADRAGLTKGLHADVLRTVERST